MATLSKSDLTAALTRLGELANAKGQAVELLLLGGGLMVLAFDERQSTRDVDVIILQPKEAAEVRAITTVVAIERSWPADWLNDAAKGFFVGPAEGPVIFSAAGITIRRPLIEQALAMKLCAWRDDLYISDAKRLLSELSGSRESIWERVGTFLQPGKKLKAQYAFEDLWEESHGPN